jgi:hypothetical protein
MDATLARARRRFLKDAVGLGGAVELHALMDTFEQKEKALPLGDFEKMVVDVRGIEKAFGLDDLAKFTPKPGAP